MSALVIEIPLPDSVRRGAIAPTIVTSRPSRIQTVPRPTTIRQWKRAHGSRSRRLGIWVRTTRPRSALVRGRAAPEGAVAVVISPAPWVRRRLRWDAALPAARPSLPVRRRRRDHALGLHARLRRGGREALCDRRRGGALCARLRARARRHRPPHAGGRLAPPPAPRDAPPRRRLLSRPPRRTE